MAGRSFSELRKLWADYVETLGPTERAKILAMEFGEKCYCLDRLLDNVDQIKDGLRGKSVASGDAAEIAQSLIWAKFLAQTFAFHAWRMRKELRELPELGHFDPAGVRTARNELMEHRDGPKARTVQGSLIFGTGWPYVRPQRFPGDPASIESGLTYNADEFINQLETKLQNAIKRRCP
jgi:hypothetical protein